MTFWEYAPGLFLNLAQVTHLEDASPHNGEGVVRVVFTSGVPRLLTAEKSAELRRLCEWKAVFATGFPFTETHTR